MFGILSLPAEVFSLSTIEELFPTSLRAGTMTEASFSRNWHGGASVRGNTWILLTPKGSAADCMVGGFLSNAGATQPLYNPKCKPQKLGFTFRYRSNSGTIWEHEQLLQYFQHFWLDGHCHRHYAGITFHEDRLPSSSSLMMPARVRDMLDLWDGMQ